MTDSAKRKDREAYKTCGPWMAGDVRPLRGRVRNAICIKHGGTSRGPCVLLANERCGVARRMLPAAR